MERLKMTQNTPVADFFTAIRDRSVEKVKFILEQNQVDGKMLNHPYAHVSPAAFAAEVGDCEILQLILDHGADINFGGKRGQLPLYIAARRNHLDVVRLCIKAGANIDQQHLNGNTPLLEAAKCGHVEVAAELLKSGSNLHTFNNGGDSALHMAAFEGNLPLLKLFLEAGLHADLQKMEGRHHNIPTGVRPLHLAVLGDYHEVAEVLISHGASVNALMNNSGQSPLHPAARRDSLKTAELLLKHGCNVNVMDNHHKTPLTHAIDSKHHAMVELLVSAGADVNTRDKWGAPALINAAFHDSLDIMVALIRGGCNVNAATNNGITPIGACIRHPFRSKMASLLTRAGSRASAQDLENVFTDQEIENYEMLVHPCSLQEACRYVIVSHIRNISAREPGKTDNASADNSNPPEGSSGAADQHQRAAVVQLINTRNYIDSLQRLELPPKLKSFLQFHDLNEILEVS